MSKNNTTTIEIVEKRKRGRPRGSKKSIVPMNQNTLRPIGRPRGSFSRHTLKNLARREAFAKLVEENVQEIFNSYYDAGVNRGDVHALDTLLAYAWGRPSQSIDLNANVKIDLVQLSLEASKLYENKDGVYVEKAMSIVSSEEKQTP